MKTNRKNNSRNARFVSFLLILRIFQIQIDSNSMGNGDSFGIHWNAWTPKMRHACASQFKYNLWRCVYKIHAKWRSKFYCLSSCFQLTAWHLREWFVAAVIIINYTKMFVHFFVDCAICTAAERSLAYAVSRCAWVGDWWGERDRVEWRYRDNKNINKVNIAYCWVCIDCIYGWRVYLYGVQCTLAYRGRHFHHLISNMC